MPRIGEAYGCLTIVKVLDKRISSGKCECVCICGRYVVVKNNALISGVNRVCNRQHKFTNSLAYQSWCEMKRRCQDTKHHSYKLYGGRGIKVCERWDSSFANFLEDMGERPSKENSLDRIDCDGNYEPSNCRWATRVEQANNTRKNHKLTHNNKTLTVAQWSRETKIPLGTLRSRIDRGWDVEKALNTPVIK